ncbi:hypothetical protein OG21DRAFT_640320 [Imleria badia]|nr:hypothetical protein OG21DRAFT_640320 [Imleria badia]
MPVGFYILIQFNDTKRRTENKPVCLHENVVEWDDRIQLPSDPSAKVQLSVCASFEFSPMLGSGEILRTVEICVGDLLDNTHLFTFSPTEREPLSPCSSLLITMERQRSHKSGTASDHDEDFGWEVSSELAQITDQGHNALLRYRDDPRKENVAVSVGHFEHALSICPDGHRCYAAALCNLAMAHFINCQIDRGPVELSTAISYYREALKLRHVCHPDRPATLLHLAEVLLYRYGKLGFEDFPGEIMELTSEVQINCSADSHERRAADLALQTYTIYKAISSGSLVDIEKLIPALRQSVQHIPYEHFDKLQRLTNLGLALRICYELGGDLGDLDDSIATHEEAMQSIPCHHPYEPVLLTNLGVLFLGRFGQSGDHEDLSRSISLIEDAIRCTPHHHFDYAIRLTSLGNALLTRFQLLDDKEDLSRSTSVLEIAAWLTAQHPPNHPAACYTPWSNPPMFPVTPPTFPVTPPIHPAAWHTPWSHPPNLPAASPTTPWLTPSPHLAPRLPPPHHPAARLTLPDNPVALPTQSYHPERPAVLVILAVSRFTQFYELDSQCDLNSAISTMDEALQLTPSGHFARPRMLSILSAFYFARFEISCDLADLDNSIFNIQEAIGLVPRGHFGRPKMVTALRSLVLIRLQMFDWAVDCDKSIGILEEIVQTTHDNDPSKPSSFAHLGTLFFIRFQQLNDLRDLDKAISTLKATLQLAIRRQLDPFELLMRLGVLFRVRFDKAGEVGDLERSVESIEDALALAPSGTESRSLFDAPEDPVSTF